MNITSRRSWQLPGSARPSLFLVRKTLLGPKVLSVRAGLQCLHLWSGLRANLSWRPEYGNCPDGNHFSVNLLLNPSTATLATLHTLDSKDQSYKPVFTSLHWMSSKVVQYFQEELGTD